MTITKAYFNKWILRAGFIPLLILLVVGFSMNDYNRIEVEFCCKEVAFYSCTNPYYNNISVDQSLCKFGDLCSNELVAPGDCVRSESVPIMKYYNTIAIFILFLTFGLNHVYFKHKEDFKK